MPHYATCFPIVWRLRGLNATLRDQLPHSLAIKGLNATLRDQPPHGLAIKGVKCHGTRPACLHGLAIMGVKSHGTRPAGTVVIG
ncbi:hypothetical protein [Klebsiella quasipneumoniae]|uniref:hypothetical protein n=1 Tax=Klebsiella quasipneumoniae TaxID=1463165 RepID=UPI003014843D